MTNAKLYQGFLNDEKIEEHWLRIYLLMFTVFLLKETKLVGKNSEHKKNEKFKQKWKNKQLELSNR